MSFHRIKERIGIRGRVVVTMRDAKTGRIVSRDIHENLIVTGGKSAIAARLAGDTTKANRGEITFGSVGTGTTAPSAADTKLETEFFRKVLAVRKVTVNVAILRLFLSTSEGNTTLKEFALFGEDASVTPDSGTMFNRVLIDRTKTSANTLTIEALVTVGA